jgi:hypothetical protein
MTIYNSFDSTVARMFAEKLASEIEASKEAMLTGGLKSDTADKTAMNFSDSIGYVRGITNAMQWLKDIEDELMGRHERRKRA